MRQIRINLYLFFLTIGATSINGSISKLKNVYKLQRRKYLFELQVIAQADSFYFCLNDTAERAEMLFNSLRYKYQYVGYGLMNGQDVTEIIDWSVEFGKKGKNKI